MIIVLPACIYNHQEEFSLASSERIKNFVTAYENGFTMIPWLILEGPEGVYLLKWNQGLRLVHQAATMKDLLEFHGQCWFFFFHLLIFP